MNEVYIQKQDIIRRCLKRIEDEYGGDGRKWEAFVVQDAIMLNLLRACEASIDLAMFVVSKKKLGAPTDTRDAFFRLERAGILNAGIAAAMRNMVGFRNLAVHTYQELDMTKVKTLVDERLNDFELLLKALGQALL